MAADKEGQKDIKMIEQIQKSQTQPGRSQQNEDDIRDMLKENNIKNAIVLQVPKDHPLLSAQTVGLEAFKEFVRLNKQNVFIHGNKPPEHYYQHLAHNGTAGGPIMGPQNHNPSYSVSPLIRTNTKSTSHKIPSRMSISSHSKNTNRSSQHHNHTNFSHAGGTTTQS